MKALAFDRFGEPAEVLGWRDVPDPVPGPGEVRVRMIASPINPSDLMVVRGIYGVLPKLPATPGFEGVGVVESAGPGVYGKWLVGRRVAVLNSAGGNWAELAIVPAIRAIPRLDALPEEQVASFFVNPATVLAMVRHVLQVPKGAWLVQSAAGSTLGRMVIKLGRHDGFRTVNVVRRHAAIDELKALGADAVIASEDGPIVEQVQAATGGQSIHCGLDPVGGATGTALFRSLASPARLVVYGTLSREPLEIDPRLMISARRVVEGFWLGHWMLERSKVQSVLLFREIAGLIRSGVLASEVGPAFAAEQIAEAVTAAEAVGRVGKVLLRLRTGR